MTTTFRLPKRSHFNTSLPGPKTQLVKHPTQSSALHSSSPLSLSKSIFQDQHDIVMNRYVDNIQISNTQPDFGDDGKYTNKMTHEEYQEQQRRNKLELFQSANASKDGYNEKMSSATVEATLEQKHAITNDLEHLTEMFKAQALGISSQLQQDTEVISKIEQNVDDSAFRLDSIGEKLRNIVTAGWWDLFTNMTMLFTASVVFSAVMAVIFFIPKAKWL